MAKITEIYCDRCNEKISDYTNKRVHEVSLNTEKEYITKDLCAECYKEYQKKLTELGEWLKEEKI